MKTKDFTITTPSGEYVAIELEDGIWEVTIKFLHYHRMTAVYKFTRYANTAVAQKIFEIDDKFA